MGKFPECFPSDFESRILPKEAKEENRAVYRVMKYGKIDKDGFISTFEEIKFGLRPQGKLDLNDPSLYSTSCYENREDLDYVLSILMRKNPSAFIVKGETERSCGPCQLTKERKKCKDSHVDWWIYEESNPEQYFKKEG